MWAINDSSGNLRMVKNPAYYAPKVRVRLLSTTSLLQTYPDKSIKIISGNLTRGKLVANPKNNLPTSEAHSFEDTPIAVEALNVAISTVNASNINLSEPEKELRCWHHRLGNMNFRKIQFLMRTGILSKSETCRHLHTASCKIVTPPSAQHANMASNIKVQFTERQPPSSRIALVFSEMVTFFLANKSQCITSLAKPKVACSHLPARV